MSTMENELFDKFPRICHLLKYSCKKEKMLFYLWIQQARAYAANYSFEIVRTILSYKKSLFIPSKKIDIALLKIS